MCLCGVQVLGVENTARVIVADSDEGDCDIDEDVVGEIGEFIGCTDCLGGCCDSSCSCRCSCVRCGCRGDCCCCGCGAAEMVTVLLLIF